MNNDRTFMLRQLPAPTAHRIHLEALLDEALAASFPSSDPIAVQASLPYMSGRSLNSAK
jgi:hypothetical protein